MTSELDALLAVGSYPEPAGGAVEEQLPAGDVTVGVVRIGGTVRRPRQRQSCAVAAYLRHLEASGFVGAPRFLGTDARGRDVLDHLDGDTAGTPPDDWIDNAALHWAPIGDPEDRTPALRDADPLHRTRWLADGYRLGREERAALADVALRASMVGWERMRMAAETLGGGWARMWDEGVGDVIKRRQRWLTEHGDALTAALLR